jgi:hypothetical protein
MAFGDRIKAMVASNHSNISSSGLIGGVGKLTIIHLKLKCTEWKFIFLTGHLNKKYEIFSITQMYQHKKQDYYIYLQICKYFRKEELVTPIKEQVTPKANVSIKIH